MSRALVHLLGMAALAAPLLHRTRLARLALAVVALQPGLAAANETTDELRKAGDILQFALPLTALGATAIHRDGEGARQFTYSFGGALATQVVMKPLVGKLRPDAGSRHSYPSGHTQSAFSGAAFLDTRYGPAWGIPAYALAAVTAYSRVRADAHFADDVLAGASIAVLWNWAMVEPLAKGVTVAPMPVPGGAGLAVQMTETLRGQLARGSTPLADPRWRFEYQFTPAYLEKNVIRAPSNGGATFDLDTFDKEDDPTTASVVRLEWFIERRHSLEVMLAWFESRDNGRFATPVVFGGTMFAANVPIRSAYRAYHTRFTYRYNLLPEGPWIAKVGVAVDPIYASVGLTAGTQTQTVHETGIAVAPHLMLGYNFNRRWQLVADAAGLAMGDDKMVEAGITLRYRLSDRWDVGIGYRRAEARVDTGRLFNDVAYNAFQFSVAHQW